MTTLKKEIDVTKCQSVRDFMIMVARAFDFAHHYEDEEMTGAAWDDQMTDLSWLPKECVYIDVNFSGWDVVCSRLRPQEKDELLYMLYSVARFWRHAHEYNYGVTLYERKCFFRYTESGEDKVIF